MNAGKKYFQELTLNLQHEGFTVKPKTEDGLLPVEMDGQRLCCVTKTGGVRYRREDVSGNIRTEALDRVTGTARTTAEYMSQMETAPVLQADGLSGDYRLLAEFSGVVLVGCPTKYGVQFVTWQWINDRTSLWQGHYYGPGSGVDSYAAAKRDFAVRSGLILDSALFAQEQLVEIYRSILETLNGVDPLTEERQKRLESAAEQIERGVPDLEARVAQSKQEELAAMEAPQDCGMQFS